MNWLWKSHWSWGMGLGVPWYPCCCSGNLSWLYIYISSALNHNLEIKVWSKPSGGGLDVIYRTLLHTNLIDSSVKCCWSEPVQWSWASECSTATYICSNPHGECGFKMMDSDRFKRQILTVWTRSCVKTFVCLRNTSLIAMPASI